MNFYFFLLCKILLYSFIYCQKDVVILENGVPSPLMDSGKDECAQFSIRIPYQYMGHTEISALNTVPNNGIYFRQNFYATPDDFDFKLPSTSSFNFPLAENTSFINWYFCVQGNTVDGHNAQYIVTVSLTDRNWRLVLTIFGSIGLVCMVLCCCLVGISTFVFILLNQLGIIKSSYGVISPEERSTLLVGKGKGKYRVSTIPDDTDSFHV